LPLTDEDEETDLEVDADPESEGNKENDAVMDGNGDVL
jgi:hypothetical protein